VGAVSFEAVRGRAASEVFVNSQGIGLSIDERRRLLAANAAAAQYFRWELLRATGGWPLEYLKAHGAESVLAVDSPWKVGYAPRTWSNLVDHLHGQGFGYGTLARAGLLAWNDHGDAIDRHRDKLMLVARDRRLSAVGFVGIGPDGHARSVSPVSAIHRPANVLVGIEEQRDLLGGGAIPVIVDSPMDAIMVSTVGRQQGGRWAGIPVCGGGLSTSQVKTLREFSTSDKVIILVSGSQAERNQTAAYALDLAFFYDRVWAVAPPSGETLAGLSQTESGVERLHDLLLNSRPLMSYRASGRGFVALQSADLDPPVPGPSL
jgi:DNA primase